MNQIKNLKNKIKANKKWSIGIGIVVGLLVILIGVKLAHRPVDALAGTEQVRITSNGNQKQYGFTPEEMNKIASKIQLGIVKKKYPAAKKYAETHQNDWDSENYEQLDDILGAEKEDQLYDDIRKVEDSLTFDDSEGGKVKAYFDLSKAEVKNLGISNAKHVFENEG